eukprot:m.220990 g.220990  ORF g.220990 m.220990 type:complete len:181 (+) comp15123_c0_seq3:237-779(+)
MAHAQGVPSAVPSGVPRFSVEVSWPVAISTWVHRNRFWLVRVQNVLDVRHNSPAFFGAVAAWAIVLSILQWVSIPLVPLGCCLGIVYVIVAHRMLQRNDQDRNLETPLTSQQRETLAMFKDELLAWHRYLSTAVDTAVNSQYVRTPLIAFHWLLICISCALHFCAAHSDDASLPCRVFAR